MKKVKLSFPYPNWPIKQQLPLKRTVWQDCEFFINPKERNEKYDVHFVFNYPIDNEDQTVTKQTVLITGEPESVQLYSPKYVEQFDAVVTSQPSIKHPNKIMMQQGLPWFIEKSYDELCGMPLPEKSKVISIISSNKVITPGHRQRLKFALKVKKVFKDKVDLYGRGLVPMNYKWQALASYMYTIVVENSRYNDYFTEKLVDSFLAYTFPLYYGAPNINKYFDEESYITIDINKPKESLSIIERLIENKEHYFSHIQSLIEQRNKVLNKYNLFALMADLAKLTDCYSNYQLKSIHKLLPTNELGVGVLNRIWKVANHVIR